MNNAIVPIISHILTTYGGDIFTNTGRSNAMLLDLAPGMTRERILVRGFVEIGGYKALRTSGDEYLLVKNNLIQSMKDTFCLEKDAALWVVQVFAVALGFETGLPEEIPEVKKIIPNRNFLVALGKAHAAAAAMDGTVFAGGNNEHYQCDVTGWLNVIAVAAGDTHTLGLKADGTVLAAGLNTYDQCDVGRESDVAAVYAFGNDTVCVHTDGTLTSSGFSKLDVSHFSDIRAIFKHPEGITGVRSDGCVFDPRSALGFFVADEEHEWLYAQQGAEQIISTYVNGSIVLKQDGRLYKSNQPENYFAPWRDVVSMADVSDGFAILRKDGTVRVLAYDRDLPRKPCASDAWAEIVALYGRYKRLIGLTADGYLVSACTDPDWQKRNGSLDFISNWFPIGGS
jgi:hypothetical protein